MTDSKRNAELSRELLVGAVDLHIHTAPDIYPRTVTVVEAAEQARDAGMRAIVAKSHSADSSARAELARLATGFPVYGGVALNYSVGGVNPYAVTESARQGGRIVWLPTTSARHFLAHAANAPILRSKSPNQAEGLVATNGHELLPETEAVLQAVKANDLILCSGHVSPDEAIMVFERAAEIGIKRLVVTHPHAEFVGATTRHMKQLAELGAKNEMQYAFVTAAIQPPQTLALLAEQVREVGIENCFMATDGGQSINPVPLEMMRLFIEGFLDLGFTEDEIRQMTAETPGRLLLEDRKDAAEPDPAITVSNELQTGVHVH